MVASIQISSSSLMCMQISSQACLRALLNFLMSTKVMITYLKGLNSTTHKDLPNQFILIILIMKLQWQKKISLYSTCRYKRIICHIPHLSQPSLAPLTSNTTKQVQRKRNSSQRVWNLFKTTTSTSYTYRMLWTLITTRDHIISKKFFRELKKAQVQQLQWVVAMFQVLLTIRHKRKLKQIHLLDLLQMK